MTSETWKKITEIFQSAIELEPAERKAFLDERCAGDQALRAEIESLLSADAKAENFIEYPAILDIEPLLEDEEEAPLLGKQLGNYKIVSQLGAGGMGDVYLAQDLRLDRKVAIKTLPRFSSKQANQLRRFENEARTISALNHPNILTIYEIGEDEGVPFIATEYVAGETLRARLERGALALNEALEIAIQIASALSAAHDRGIIHRDIKPENVMLREDGYVKVLDFGLAKLTAPLGENEKTLFQSNPGIIRGTVAYMSPEQARGLAIDLRTDIWSFGVLLYELLARRAPFAGETATDLMLAIIQKEPPDLQSAVSLLPNELYFIVNKTLRKKADERYQKIADVLVDLRRVKQKSDFDEIQRALSPEDIKLRGEKEQRKTVVLARVSAGFGRPAATISSETLPPNNLLMDSSPLIGRKSEIKEIKNLLNQPEIRLLTITGVGGTGKTRLAQALARESLADFADGVYFISLSAIENAQLILPVIAQSLSIREEGGIPLRSLVHEYLRERQILLVLDNFEQIVEAAAQVGELLSGSANLKIVVTSRVRLQLRPEQEFTLQPLEVPVEENLNPAELIKYPSIKLFVERAQAVKPAFALTDGNAQSITEICRRLDGLPLAIELAAVRVKLLTPQAIGTRLSNSLKLLTGGARDLPARQQTMRAAIAWSYDLLEAEEKKLLSRLAVFAGGFTLDAAEAIADAQSDLSIDLLNGVASLVDKSLLLQREQPDGEPRFRMLKVVREFALEALEAGGRSGEIKRRHADFYARLSETAEPHLSSENVAEWLEILNREHDNLRFALEWSLENEPTFALRIVGAIRSFCIRRGYLSEGAGMTQQALERSGEAGDPQLRAKAYIGIAAFKRFQGELAAAKLFLEEALRLTRQVGDKYWISVALGDFGLVKFMQGDLVQGRISLEESLAIARELDNRKLISIRLNSLGEIARQQRDYKAARQYYEEALAIARRESSKYLIPVYTFNLAAAACLMGDDRSAHSYALESLEISEELEDKISMANALDIFAALMVKAGEPQKAAQLWGAAQAVYDATGYKIEKIDQEFNERFMDGARMAIGDETFEATIKEGGSMRLKNAVALARGSG